MARFSMYSGEQIHAPIDVDFDTRVGVMRPLAGSNGGGEAAVLLREQAGPDRALLNSSPIQKEIAIQPRLRPFSSSSHNEVPTPRHNGKEQGNIDNIRYASIKHKGIGLYLFDFTIFVIG